MHRRCTDFAYEDRALDPPCAEASNQSRARPCRDVLLATALFTLIGGGATQAEEEPSREELEGI